MYHEKAALMFGAEQTGLNAEAAVTAADALACLEVNFDPVIESSEEKFTGDVNERSALREIIDVYGKITAKTVLPVLDGHPTLAITPWIKACGAVLDVSVADTLSFSNATLTKSMLTAHFRRTQTGEGQDKLFKILNALFSLDIKIGMKEVSTLSFSGQGEYSRSSNEDLLLPDYGVQRTAVAPMHKQGNHSCQFGGSALNIENLSLTNFFGVDITRLLLSYQKSFELTGTAGEASFDVVEKGANEGFDPESMVNKAGEFKYTLGKSVGRTVEFFMSRLVIKEWKPSSVNSYAGQSVTAVNEGYSTITFK